jgi:hypothetical protein
VVGSRGHGHGVTASGFGRDNAGGRLQCSLQCGLSSGFFEFIAAVIGAKKGKQSALTARSIHEAVPYVIRTNGAVPGTTSRAEAGEAGEAGFVAMPKRGLRDLQQPEARPWGCAIFFFLD